MDALSFLPVSKEEMHRRDWWWYDFLLVTGDAYVDHPTFGAAVIGRVLDSGEVGDNVLLRNGDDAAWMLAGGALNVLTVRRQIFLHRPAHRDIHLLTIA